MGDIVILNPDNVQDLVVKHNEQILLIESQAKEIEKLSKKIESLETNSKYIREAKENAEKEIEQVHCMLDGLPINIPRETEKKSNGYTQTIQLNLLTRIAIAWSQRNV